MSVYPRHRPKSGWPPRLQMAQQPTLWDAEEQPYPQQAPFPCSWMGGHGVVP